MEENSKGANRQEEVRFGLSDGKSLTQRSGSREEASLWPGRGSAACTDGMRSAKSPGRKNMSCSRNQTLSNVKEFGFYSKGSERVGSQAHDPNKLMLLFFNSIWAALQRLISGRTEENS